MKKLFIYSLFLISLKANTNIFNITGEYSISTNLIDKGESLTNNNPAGFGSIKFDYSDIYLQLSTFASSGETQIDTNIGYTYSVDDDLKLGLYYLNTSISNSSEDGLFKSRIGEELSFTIEYSIYDFINIEFNMIRDMKEDLFTIYQFAISKDIYDIGIELLYGKSINKDKNYSYYQSSFSYSFIKNNIFGLNIANTTKQNSKLIYTLFYSVNF